jgi:predicted TIM-barrel fold metal-dependent hydrolase
LEKTPGGFLNWQQIKAIMLNSDLPELHDVEGERVPEGLPPVIDGHVHVFPRNIFSAIWSWFDQHAWPIRYRLSTSEILQFLLSRGIKHIIALQYAHKPGLARMLNTYLAGKCREFPGRVSGMATIFPGEEDSRQILQEAFDQGLIGVKLHAHVQCFDMNSPAMETIYDLCQSAEKPMVMHVGREPKSPAYLCDPYQICSAEKLERVLIHFPKLKICVPHLGFDEVARYRALIEKYDTLWLDTTMMLADYFPSEGSADLTGYRMERIFYGSDFPNIPYSWDRELKRMKTLGLSEKYLEWLLYKNAAEFFNLEEGP